MKLNLKLIGHVCLALGLLVAALPGPAAAQGSLFDQAKKALEGVTDTVPGGDALSSPGGGVLNDAEIADGLREALRVGTERAVGQVGAQDGYNADPKIHIPLPGSLKDVQSVLKGFGMAGMADDLELRLNRAAEAAAPEAEALFWQAIDDMTLEDVQGIYSGPDDAATRYFQGKMTPPLAERMAPVVNESLAEVGAIQSYDEMMGQYKAVPFVPDAKADLTDYVVEKGMDGLFHYVAEEEAAIRNNPAERTTELLQRVFGAN
jgi:hypothetical protein